LSAFFRRLQVSEHQRLAAEPSADIRVRGFWQWAHGIQESHEALARYLLSLERGGPPAFLTADPSIKGRFFYRDDMRGTNFERHMAPLSAGLQGQLTHLNNQRPPAIYYRVRATA
jgi:hypothetical protein